MKPVSSISNPLHLPSIALVGLLAFGCAGTALADKRHPAPIVYATGTSPYPAGTPQYIEPSRSSDAQSRKQARIQFRYPDQSGSTYAATSLETGGQGATATAPAARQYASIQAPAPSYGTSASASAADSFDARAAAARIEAQRTVSTIESDALPALSPTPAPAPVPAPATSMPRPAATGSLTPAASFAVSGQPGPVFDETGIGIVYGAEFDGLPTANGELFDPNALTAAHPNLPLPSLIQVVNPQTGKEVVLRVNDRGPFEDGASLQVSQRAAQELGMDGAGRANLRIRYLGAAPAAAAPAGQAPAPAYQAPEPQLVAETTYPQQAESQDYLVPAAYTPAPAQPQVQPQAQYQYSAPAPVSGGDYFVQIGSFTDIANAQTLSNQVQASLPVTIVPARVNGADFFRVRVGPLADRTAAERARQDLSYAGIADGRIVSGD